MKYQVLKRILNKSSFPRKFERLELDENFCIIDKSEQVQCFAAHPEEVLLGKDIRLGFPEFIGLEDILQSILQGKQEIFDLEGIDRCSQNCLHLYIDIYIINEQLKSESKLIILIEDVTKRMILKQKLVQSTNEANLLSSALRENKKYWDQLIDSIADVLLVTSNSGKIKKANIASQNLFGFTEEELINQPISLIFDDASLGAKIIRQNTIYQQDSENIELVCRNKRGEKILVSFSCSVIPQKISGLEDIIYIGRDITAHQRREKFKSAQFAITHILSESQNAKQAIPQVLQAICQNMEWDLGELWTPNQYINVTTDRSSINVVLRCIEIWSSRVISARKFKAITWQTTYNSGVGLPGKIWVSRSPVWIKDITSESDRDLQRSPAAIEAGLHAAFGFPILDDEQILGVMTFFSREAQPKDINLLQMMGAVSSQISQFLKRKQAEKILAESEQKYRDLFENTNDLIQSFDAYGQLLYVNHTWQITLGYSEAELANLNIFEIIHPDFQEHCRQIFYRLMSGEKLEPVKIALIAKNGQAIFLKGNISCQFINNKPVATCGIFRNITQQQAQIENLLNKILPKFNYQPLQKLSSNITENFFAVTVLFADIISSNEIATSISTMQLVNLINSTLAVFDRLSERYGLERIKAIGDTYIVVGRRAGQAQAIAHLALDMQSAIAILNSENNQNFHICISIDSLPVAASLADDCWEKIAKIARLMKFDSNASKIQVTEAIYQNLCDKFLLEKPEEMTSYLLIGSK